MKAFWSLMLPSKVKFEALSAAVHELDKAVRLADRSYKQILARHASNVKIMRLYGKFLEHVKHDPWSAAKWFAEAETLEQHEEDLKNTTQFQDMEGACWEGGGSGPSDWGREGRRRG